MAESHTKTVERHGGTETVREEKTVTTGDKKGKKAEKDLDRRLDEALEETFPSSDPVSISQPTGPEKPER